MDEREAVDQDGHIIAILVVALSFILVDHLKPVVMDILLIDQIDIFRSPIIPLQNLDMILLDLTGFLNNAFIGRSE